MKQQNMISLPFLSYRMLIQFRMVHGAETCVTPTYK